ncbi:MAG: hypothetical protein ACU0B9_17060 [Limimaricola soesokkakensis]|uniref:hypothetical protein n=1 Tax=Limimaricola soesokkakensis TaxID=1343159 RepID=UPI004059E6D9
MSIDPTFTYWTAVFIPAGEVEPTAMTADFNKLGEGDPVDARGAMVHFRSALGAEANVLDVYPFPDPDEALEIYRATETLKIAGM